MVNPIKSVLQRGASSEKFKYNLLICAIAGVHVLLVLMFSFFRILPLIILNLCSVSLYISCLIGIKRNKNLFKMFLATYLEIIVQSFVATICIGWYFGFPQYIIALVPFGYYMCYSLVESRRKYVIATLMGLVAFISFIGCRMLSTYFGALYELHVSEGVELGIYIFNSVCNFGFLFLVTIIYIAEMQMATNKLRSQNAILDNLANVDPLTGLYNRRSMQTFLNRASDREAEKTFCLVMCDIDNFKKVNDTYGHDFGDIVLREIAQIIQRQVKEYGQVCRWGGEEILLLIGGSLEQACEIAENIRRDVSEFDFVMEDLTIHCSITIGVALHRLGETIDNTITHADNNLYYGKRNGKNQVVSE